MTGCIENVKMNINREVKGIIPFATRQKKMLVPIYVLWSCLIFIWMSSSK